MTRAKAHVPQSSLLPGSKKFFPHSGATTEWTVADRLADGLYTLIAPLRSPSSLHLP